MIEARVSSGGAFLYRTSSVRQGAGYCTVTRLNSRDNGLVNNEGPHFTLCLPPPLFTCPLAGEATSYSATGKGTLGTLAMCAGPAARDGTESYHIAALSAEIDASTAGLRFSLSAEIGSPDPRSFSGRPLDLRGRRYEVDALIPFEDLGDLFYEYRFNSDWWTFIRRDVEKHFGVTIPAQKEHSNA